MKNQFCNWFCTSVIVTILSTIAAEYSPANAQVCAPYNEYVVNRIRQLNKPTGRIFINNNYGPDPQSGSVKIRLYHSDATSQVFSTWNFFGGESANLSHENQNIIIGGDWGIQIVFGNRVSSCIIPVARVSRFENGRFVVVASDIYDGFK